MGVNLSSLNFRPDTSTRAAAPSDNDDAFGAVTVPSAKNAGRTVLNLASFNYHQGRNIY